jgi:hypothetical protein
VLTTEQVAQFDQCDVQFGINRTQYDVPIGLDVVRTKIATLRQRRQPPLDPPVRYPRTEIPHGPERAAL